MKPRQEEDGLKRRGLLVTLVGVVAVVAAAVVIAAWLQGSFRSELGAEPESGGAVIALPRAVGGSPMSLFDDPDPPEIVAAEERLSSYGWVDEDEGIVHVPIDVAIDLYLERAEDEAR